MLTLEDARKVIAAAERKAKAIEHPMNIAVADAGGNLVAHVRMDEAWMGSIDIAIKKAFTSTTPFALTVYRTQLFKPEDMPNVEKVQAGYKAQPLSAYLKQPAPPAAPKIDFSAEVP